jgi:O-antigen/teichoic acid export membrane protein
VLKIRHILSTTGATVVAGGMQLVMTFFIAHQLVPTENGHYAQFALIFNLVFVGLNFGLGPASTFFIASQRATGDEVGRLNIRVSLALLVILVLTSLFAWFGGLLDQIERVLKIPAPILVLGFFSGYVFLAFNQVLAMLMGAHRYDQANLLNVLRAGMALVAVMLWSALGSHDSFGMSMAHSLALVALLVVSLVAFVAGNWRRETPSKTDMRSLLHGMLRYGALVYASNLLHYLAMRGLLLLLSYYNSPDDVGFISMALLLLEVTLLVPSAIGQLVFPQSSRSDFDHRAMELILRVNILASIVVSVLVAFLIGPVVGLVMGPAYAPVATILLNLIPSIILLAIPRILSQLLSGQGYPHFPLAAAAISLFCGTLLAVWLIPLWGVVGAAWIINLVSAITAFVTLTGYCKVHGVSILYVLKITDQDWQRFCRVVTGAREA